MTAELVRQRTLEPLEPLANRHCGPVNIATGEGGCSSDRRDEVSRLALVEPPRASFPPEPLRFAGGTAIRRALVGKDAAEDDGRRPGPVTRLVAGLPRRLGLHLPR